MAGKHGCNCCTKWRVNTGAVVIQNGGKRKADVLGAIAVQNGGKSTNEMVVRNVGEMFVYILVGKETPVQLLYKVAGRRTFSAIVVQNGGNKKVGFVTEENRVRTNVIIKGCCVAIRYKDQVCSCKVYYYLVCTM